MHFFTVFIALFLLLSGFAVPAAASVSQQLQELNETIDSKTLRRSNFEQRATDNKKLIRQLKNEQSSLNLDLKKLHLESKKIQSMASNPPSSQDKKRLDKINYKRKVVELAQKKNDVALAKQEQEQTRLDNGLKRLQKLLFSLTREQRNLESQVQATKQAQLKQAQLAKAKRVAEKRAQQQREKLRKQRLAAEAKRKAEQQAQLQKQQQAEKQKQAAALAAKAANEKALKIAAEKAEQQRLNAEKQRQEAELARKMQSMNQRDAAMANAKYIAGQTQTTAPALGDAPRLRVANPVGSKPKNITQMQHLGNHQYMANITVRKGRQQFIVGQHSFKKSIPKHFHGLNCLILVDARDGAVKFQMVAAK